MPFKERKIFSIIINICVVNISSLNSILFVIFLFVKKRKKETQRRRGRGRIGKRSNERKGENFFIDESYLQI